MTVAGEGAGPSSPNGTHPHRRTRRPCPRRRRSRRPPHRTPRRPPEDKIKYAKLRKVQGSSLGQIAAKTGIPKTSLHRYLQV
ncbi:helix-turn-helix domain-containing protein [Streptomyces sp. MB09-02B]|uniref:helix-turn-helix domain-containing protein n=1 Tax=Streptomyces sp. MB09-02B TaxID=3028667 RepID=UPI0039AF9A36